MSKTVENIISNIRECDDFHNRCDYLLEHDEATYLIEEMDRLKEIEQEHKKINGELRDTISKSLKLIETWDNEGLPATTIVGHIYSDLVPLLKHDSK